jgi:hypothetical protein
VHHHRIFKGSAISCHLPIEQVKSFCDEFQTVFGCILVSVHAVHCLKRDLNCISSELKERRLFEFFLTYHGGFLLPKLGNPKVCGLSYVHLS